MKGNRKHYVDAVPLGPVKKGYFCVLSGDQKSGFAITPSGELVHVFNVSGESRLRNITKLARLLNPADTKLHLSCFWPLNEVYARHGWVEKYAIAFDPSQAPKEWPACMVKNEPPVYIMELKQ